MNWTQLQMRKIKRSLKHGIPLVMNVRHEQFPLVLQTFARVLTRDQQRRLTSKQKRGFRLQLSDLQTQRLATNLQNKEGGFLFFLPSLVRGVAERKQKTIRGRNLQHYGSTGTQLGGQLEERDKIIAAWKRDQHLLSGAEKRRFLDDLKASLALKGKGQSTVGELQQKATEFLEARPKTNGGKLFDERTGKPYVEGRYFGSGWKKAAFDVVPDKRRTGSAWEKGLKMARLALAKKRANRNKQTRTLWCD